LIFADHTYQAVQFMGRETNILCQRNRLDPEFGTSAIAANVDMWGLAWVSLIRKKEEHATLPSENYWHHSPILY
jgi:hypothetical protein